MKLGSLFDGSGGFPLAGTLNGIEPVWASEIEPFPIRVTKQRFPHMKHLGSVTEVYGAEIEPVDIITFGSPCQDLSVAGKQAGIHEGQRSNLFFQAVRIIKEMRENDKRAGRTGVNIRPRFAVWENVPGAFSSNKGADFRAVLQAIGEIEGGETVSVPMPPKGKWLPAGCVVGDGYSIAWRVYDAQYWGVPQRRKRIYLIADFGSERAGEILFESESVSGDPEQGGKAWEGTAEDSEGSAGGDSSVWNLKGNMIDRETQQNGVGWSQGNMYTLDATDRHGVCYPAIARTLLARADSSPCVDRGANVVCYAPTANFCGSFTESNVSETLQTKYHYGSRGDGALAVYPNDQHQMDGRFKLLQQNSPCPTLKANMGTGGNNTPMVLEERNGLKSFETMSHDLFSTRFGKDGKADTLARTDYKEPPIVAYENDPEDAYIYPGLQITSKINRSNPKQNDQSPTLTTECGSNYLVKGAKGRKYIVRRLTPTECGRLQGFPDWWCDGADGSDSAIYKMWGNGIALPCAADVLRRIAKEGQRHDVGADPEM